MVIAALLALSLIRQDVPKDIPKNELPKKAHCAVCTANGEGHEEEKAAAGVLYKGAAYYFCNAGEIKTFKSNPDLYVPLKLPMPLPEFGLADTSGKTWNGEAFKGRLILIDYWATWCKPCLALKPGLDKIRESYRDKGFEILSVSIDEKRETLDKFLAKQKWDNPVLHDTKNTWAGLKVASIPFLALVKDGQVVQVFRGSVKTKDVEAAVKANLQPS